MYSFVFLSLLIFVAITCVVCTLNLGCVFGSALSEASFVDKSFSMCLEQELLLKGIQQLSEHKSKALAFKIRIVYMCLY